MLQSHAQVKAFTAAMQDLGFAHLALPAQEDARCCDFSFRLREHVAAAARLLPA